MPPSQVYLFVSAGRFSSWEDVSACLHVRYDEDGDRIPSPFMLENFGPMCIEARYGVTPLPGLEILQGFSWFAQWRSLVEYQGQLDAAICVFPPNTLFTPGNTRLTYLGCLEFEAQG
ncbi:hypothetical protein [Deinococcus hopiensis]|uniref:hypothetical protein n=1 Tax=Deinococcus hopiensis TaxID=309885 RepID=UPI00111BF30D|nr:hypothetical protein [Deinococcus hopiensis]